MVASQFLCLLWDFGRGRWLRIRRHRGWLRWCICCCGVVVRGASVSWRVCGGGVDGFNYNSRRGDFLDYVILGEVSRRFFASLRMTVDLYLQLDHFMVGWKYRSHYELSQPLTKVDRPNSLPNTNSSNFPHPNLKPPQHPFAARSARVRRNLARPRPRDCARLQSANSPQYFARSHF